MALLAAGQETRAKPKLVVAIIVDQFRYDYLTRFRADYHGGLDQLLTQGADFTNAFYGQVPTITAVGHSIFLSGAMPAVSGIVGNSWYDRDEKKTVTSVCDWTVKTVGGTQEQPATKCTDSDPASPRRPGSARYGDPHRSALGQVIRRNRPKRGHEERSRSSFRRPRRASTPEHDRRAKMPGGYLSADVAHVVENALDEKFGKANWLIPGGGETALYFDRETIEHAKTTNGQRLDEEELYRAAKDAIFAAPQLHVARVYTRRQLDDGIAGDFIARAEANGYFPRRSGDVHIVFEPGYLPGKSGTTHFSPYSYDRHVPVLFMGPGVKPGRYDETIQPNDIAPTLATMLDIQTPSGSSGRILVEMLAR